MTVANADHDRYRTLTTAAVLLVAAIAAAISFVHIESLAVRYGQPLLAAYLLPVSIDGTVAVSSLAMLRSARLGLSAPWLARTMLLLAVGATLACNIGFGLPHGLPGALLSGWPAVAFVGSAEVAISMSRKRSPQRDRDRSHTGPAETGSTAPAAGVNARNDRTRSRSRDRVPRASVSTGDCEREFMSELASGAVPSIRQVRARMHVGQPRAVELHDHLERVAATNGASVST